MNAALRRPRTTNLRQRHVDQVKQICIKKTTSEKKPLTRSRKTKNQEPRCVMGGSISEVENDVKTLLDEKGTVSDKYIQMDNGITVSSKVANEDRLVLLAVEKAEGQKSYEFQYQRSEPGSFQIEELCKRSQLVETRSNGSSVISKTSSARRVQVLKIKAFKEQEKIQNRLEKLKLEAKQLEREEKEKEIADLHEQLARKARIAEKKNSGSVEQSGD